MMALYSKAVNIGCPKLNDPPHGGYICADANKHDHNLADSYEVRVCAPNCRTGYISNYNNSILFCTSKSKLWTLLPEEHDIQNLACVPTLNILYHNDEDRIQVRIQDFIEGKLPQDLNETYPKLVEKSDIKDVIELFDPIQRSDLNTIKSKNITIDKEVTDFPLPSFHTIDPSIPLPDNLKESKDYYNLQKSEPLQNEVNATTTKSVKQLFAGFNISQQNEDEIEHTNTDNKVNESLFNHTLFSSNASTASNMTNNTIFPNPINALKYLMDAVVASNEKETTLPFIEQQHKADLTTPANDNLNWIAVNERNYPIGKNINDGTHQFVYSRPSDEWSQIESMYVESIPSNAYNIQTESSSSHIPVTTMFPLFDVNNDNVVYPTTLNSEKSNPQLRSIKSNKIIYQNKDQYKFETYTTPLVQHPSPKKLNDITYTPPPSSNYIKVNNVVSGSHLSHALDNIKNSTNSSYKMLPRSNTKINNTKKSISQYHKNDLSKISTKNQTIVDLKSKLKDGSILKMNKKQREKLINLIKNNRKLNKSTFCRMFYPFCQEKLKQYTKRNLKYPPSRIKGKFFWTFPSSS